MRRIENLAIAAGFVLLGAAFAYYGSRYPLGSPQDPGPGLIPLASGLILAILSAGLLVSTYFSSESPTATKGSGADGWSTRSFGMVALLAAYFVLLDSLGFFASTGLFLFAGMKLSGTRGYWKPALTAVIVTLVSYMLFKVVLGLELPGTR